METWGECVSLEFLRLDEILDGDGKLTDECVCSIGHCRPCERGPEEVRVCALGKIQCIVSVLGTVIKLAQSVLIAVRKGSVAIIQNTEVVIRDWVVLCDIIESLEG